MQYSTRVKLLNSLRRDDHAKELFYRNVCGNVCLNAPDTPAGGSAARGGASTSYRVDRQVDARGRRCPMPLLMAKRALNGLGTGQTLRLLATDAGSLRDFEVFSRQSGHELLAAEEHDGEYLLVLKKA